MNSKLRKTKKQVVTTNFAANVLSQEEKYLLQENAKYEETC